MREKGHPVRGDLSRPVSAVGSDVGLRATGPFASLARGVLRLLRVGKPALLLLWSKLRRVGGLQGSEAPCGEGGCRVHAE